MGFDLNRLVDTNIDESFLCPICCGLIQNPTVLIECGHIFCSDCIENWKSTKAYCPVYECTAEDLSSTVVNQEFADNYSNILLKCENFNLGCQQSIQINNEKLHSTQCKFNKINFFNCDCGDFVNKTDETHNCIEFLKNQIQNLNLNQIKLEIINKELEEKLKQKTEEWIQMKSFLNFSKQLETTAELRDLVEALKDLQLVQSSAVERTLLSVDRCIFCPQNPYNNYKTDIGFGAEFNSPVIDSIILEILKENLMTGANILDIGCGTGYLSACMAIMCANQCSIVAVDHIPELIAKAKSNIQLIFGDKSPIQFIEGDGCIGYPTLGPYDVINIGGSLKELPKILLNQLKVGGRMCCAIGDQCNPQNLELIIKLSDGSFEERTLCKVMLKPIINKGLQLGSESVQYENDNQN